MSVKVGGTSLAKVSGRPFTETLGLDAQYIRQRSVRLELKIVAATAATVFLQHMVLPS